MEIEEFDEDLFKLFSNIIANEDEVSIIKALLLKKDFDKIIDEYIKSLRGKKNDQI